MSDDREPTVVPFVGSRKALTRTIQMKNHRRYDSSQCPHKGPFTLCKEEWAVECGDCGALLNPIWCLTKLCEKEAYWNNRMDDLAKYLKEITAELADRERTKCTHCGNMTAIRFKSKRPQTWRPTYD